MNGGLKALAAFATACVQGWKPSRFAPEFHAKLKGSIVLATVPFVIIGGFSASMPDFSAGGRRGETRSCLVL